MPRTSRVLAAAGLGVAWLLAPHGGAAGTVGAAGERPPVVTEKTSPRPAGATSAAPLTRPGPAGPTAEHAAVAAALVERHQRHRAELGLPTLRHDPGIAGLAASTASYLAWQAGELVHRRAAVGAQVGHDWPEQLWKCGLGPVAENLAWRSDPGASAREIADGLFAQWLASAPHRAVIEAPRYRSFGIGVELDAGGRWWAVAHYAGLDRPRCPHGALAADVRVLPAAPGAEELAAVVAVRNEGPGAAEETRLRIRVVGATVAGATPSSGRVRRAIDARDAWVWEAGDVPARRREELGLTMVLDGPGAVRIVVEAARSDWSEAPGRPAAGATYRATGTDDRAPAPPIAPPVEPPIAPAPFVLGAETVLDHPGRAVEPVVPAR